jgi:hypothetical protein
MYTELRAEFIDEKWADLPTDGRAIAYNINRDSWVPRNLDLIDDEGT